MSKVQKQTEEQVKTLEQYSAAHWRSIALGLHYENQMLHHLVQQLLGTNIQQEQNLDHSTLSRERRSPRRRKKCSKIDSEVDMPDSEEQKNSPVIEVEDQSVNSLEEYLRFVQETENHRERRDKDRKDENKKKKMF